MPGKNAWTRAGEHGCFLSQTTQTNLTGCGGSSYRSASTSTKRTPAAWRASHRCMRRRASPCAGGEARGVAFSTQRGQRDEGESDVRGRVFDEAPRRAPWAGGGPGPFRISYPARGAPLGRAAGRPLTADAAQPQTLPAPLLPCPGESSQVTEASEWTLREGTRRCECLRPRLRAGGRARQVALAYRGSGHPLHRGTSGSPRPVRIDGDKRGEPPYLFRITGVHRMLPASATGPVRLQSCHPRNRRPHRSDGNPRHSPRRPAWVRSAGARCRESSVRSRSSAALFVSSASCLVEFNRNALAAAHFRVNAPPWCSQCALRTQGSTSTKRQNALFTSFFTAFCTARRQRAFLRWRWVQTARGVPRRCAFAGVSLARPCPEGKRLRTRLKKCAPSPRTESHGWRLRAADTPQGRL